MDHPEPIVFTDFICNHPNSLAEAVQVRDAALELLNQGTANRGPLNVAVTDPDLVTDIVHALNMDFGASITGIRCDQWAAVLAEDWNWDEDTKEAYPTFKTYIQCDSVIDGFLGTYKAFWDHFKGPKGDDV